MTHPLYVEGVGVVPCERSYAHRLTPPTDANTVFATDMHTKNADRTLIDLSGNSNHGTVAGAVRSGGYFTDGMRFGKAGDVVNCGDSSKFELTDCFTISTVFMQSELSLDPQLIEKAFNVTGGYKLDFDSPNLLRFTTYGVKDYLSNVTPSLNTMHLLDVTFTSDYDVKFYLDGELVDTVTGSLPANISTSNLYVGGNPLTPRTFLGKILISEILDCVMTDDLHKTRFNSLAALPLYEFDASRYPSNDTVYSDNIPYSSMRVTSGSYKIDGSQLVCVTDGIIKMRNAHDFDGSEYITITIDGVEYSGTGTVTQGTVTASIEQGSTMITVEMGTDDTLDALNIRFRKVVE